VVPTRELCLQVYGDLSTAAKYLTTEDDRKVSVVSIYGGRPYEPQIEALRAGADVVVGTPGRLLDLAQQGHLQLGGLSVLVARRGRRDARSGFLPDIERILRQIPDERQAMLFSATMPDPIITLARTFMNQPTHIRAEAPHSSAVHDLTKQYATVRTRWTRSSWSAACCRRADAGATMIFTRTKRNRPEVRRRPRRTRFRRRRRARRPGSDRPREGAEAFRTGAIDVLVATDVAGPRDRHRRHHPRHQLPVPGRRRNTYVHRIGRTGGPARPVSRSRWWTGTSWPAGR